MSARIVWYVRGMSDAETPKLSIGRILNINDVRPMSNRDGNIQSRGHPTQNVIWRFHLVGDVLLEGG